MRYTYPTAFSHWEREERDAIFRVLHSDRWTMGNEVEAFEAEFAAYHGRKHCIMVNSGSSANLVALSTQKTSEHTVAVVPALAWATTYAPFMQKGIGLILQDCDDSWNTTTNSLQVPILGNPIPNNGNAIIEDCCESLGAKDVNGRQCGTFGLLSTFSFFFSHQLSAIEGGAILTDDDDLARTCRLLRNHGWSRGLDEPESFADEYKFVIPGYNVRPLELHAAIARAQLPKIDAGAAERRKNWKYFATLAATLNIKMQEITSPDGFNPFCIAFTVPTAEIRETLAKAFRAEGIDCRPAVGGSFRLQPYGASYEGPPTPNADRIHHTGMMLGCAPFDISEKIEKAATVMRKVL
jgi:CDP-6-deoxy-D-xylo-4-hexulose-3-dehydrase